MLLDNVVETMRLHSSSVSANDSGARPRGHRVMTTRSCWSVRTSFWSGSVRPLATRNRTPSAMNPVSPSWSNHLQRQPAALWTPDSTSCRCTASTAIWCTASSPCSPTIALIRTAARSRIRPGYQVPAATAIKQAAGVVTSAVGMINTLFPAEQVVATGFTGVVTVGANTSAIRPSRSMLARRPASPFPPSLVQTTACTAAVRARPRTPLQLKGSRCESPSA